MEEDRRVGGRAGRNRRKATVGWNISECKYSENERRKRKSQTLNDEWKWRKG